MFRVNKNFTLNFDHLCFSWQNDRSPYLRKTKLPFPDHKFLFPRNLNKMTVLYLKKIIRKAFIQTLCIKFNELQHGLHSSLAAHPNDDQFLATCSAAFQMSQTRLLPWSWSLAFGDHELVSGTHCPSHIPKGKSQVGWCLANAQAMVSDHLSQSICLGRLHLRNHEHISPSVEEPHTLSFLYQRCHFLLSRDASCATAGQPERRSSVCSSVAALRQKLWLGFKSENLDAKFARKLSRTKLRALN